MNPLVFVLGDSISIQYGPHLEAMLAGRARYARKTGDEPALASASEACRNPNGGDSDRCAEYLTALAAGGDWRPDLLLVNCGLHDVKTDPETGHRQVPLDRYRKNLSQMLAAVAGCGVRAVWVRTTPAEDRVHNKPGAAFHRHAADIAAWNAAADEIMSAAGVPIADLWTFTRNLGGDEIFCDHVHFVESVRARQGAFLAGFVDAVL